MHWIAVNKTSKKIQSTGVCHCGNTFKDLPCPTSCELIEFTGGVRGYYFIDNEMQEQEPSLDL
ncbi:MAG: hypothetical protein COA86_02735 [Kangiella sp.]|nr:MAG: hypothetical protein COA86_02735 [Kangiella sp.]